MANDWYEAEDPFAWADRQQRERAADEAAAVPDVPQDAPQDDRREMRVFGPPGTGKTTFLSVQARKWAREFGSRELMIASFTRTAAAEVAARDTGVDQKQIGTLHSFAFHALDAPPLTVGHVGEFNDAHPEYRLSTSGDAGALDDLGQTESAGRTDADLALQRVEKLRARMVPRDSAHWPAHVLSFVRVYEGWKREAGYVDFTDLIEMAREHTSAAPKTPSIGMFDEVQDFTPLELSLVRHWGQAMRLVVLAGDDDQCLYDFKGATPDAFLTPAVPDRDKRVLSQSFRVPRAVHAVASAWIAQVAVREPKEYAPRRVDDGDASSPFVEGAAYAFDGEAATAAQATYVAPERVIDDAWRHAEDGHSVMMLTTCGYMLTKIVARLRYEGMPFHNPYRVRRGDWNPLRGGTQSRRTATDRLLAFLRPQRAVWGDESRTHTGIDVKDWMLHLQQRGLFERGVKTACESLDPRAVFGLADMFQWFTVDERPAALRAVKEGDLDWFFDHLLVGKRDPYEFPVAVARRRGASVLREPPRITVGTIHSVKGGQADVVYLFPDLPPQGWSATTAARGEPYDAIVRQFYVGMTRARERLVVCSAATPASISPLSLLRGAAA